VILTEDDIVKINKANTINANNKFFESFGKYINNSQYSDFTLVCSDGVEFPVHRLVLARASKVFDKMFEIDMCEKKENKAILSDINSATLQLMLRYIYANAKENIDVNTAVNVLYACEKYEIMELKNYCLATLMEKVEKENVLEVLITADVYNQPELEEKCLSIILM
jgi:speckle-type POZ protein